MSEQTEDVPEQMEVKRSTRCIFGNEIHTNCPVKEELTEESVPSLDINKYKLPKTSGLDSLKEMIDMTSSAFKSMNEPLARFCAVCPWLEIFLDKQGVKE